MRPHKSCSHLPKSSNISGSRKLSRDHSSLRSFCRGVPVSNNLCVFLYSFSSLYNEKKETCTQVKSHQNRKHHISHYKVIKVFFIILGKKYHKKQATMQTLDVRATVSYSKHPMRSFNALKHSFNALKKEMEESLLFLDIVSYVQFCLPDKSTFSVLESMTFVHNHVRPVKLHQHWSIIHSYLVGCNHNGADLYAWQHSVFLTDLVQ